VVDRARLPFGKFFWSDWRADPNLRACSAGARGLWMEMLCIAAAHQPPGYVAVNGMPCDEEMIARLAGIPISEVRLLLPEIETNGVSSRDRRGWIYSRRMIRDAKRRDKAQIDGKKGGNPNLCKDREKTQGVKGRDKGADKPHIPEANSDTNVSAAKAASADDLKAAVWAEGKALVATTGKPAKAAGQIVGRWRNNAPDDTTLLEIIRDAKGKMDPLAWVPAALKARATLDPMAALQRDAARIAREDQRRAAA
jgi:hypothetical protein